MIGSGDCRDRLPRTVPIRPHMLLVGLSMPRTMPREAKSPLRGFRYGVLVFALSVAWLWWLIIAAKDHVFGTEAELS